MNMSSSQNAEIETPPEHKLQGCTVFHCGYIIAEKQGDFKTCTYLSLQYNKWKGGIALCLTIIVHPPAV